MKIIRSLVTITIISITCLFYGCTEDSDVPFSSEIDTVESNESTQFKSLIRDLYLSIDSFWDGDSGWMNYSSELDVRYQETITFLLFMDSNYGTNNKDKVVSSIKYSLANLQDESGAFLIEGDFGYVRTSLYIVGMLKTLELYPEVVDDIPNIETSIKSAANWIMTVEKEWGGNHQIFGLAALELLNEKYHELAYLNHIEKLKFNLISDFVHVDENMGFFPEGPKEWDNRLLMPIVQTQIMATGFYLSLVDDPDLELLLKKTIRLFMHYFNPNTMKIDITDSYDYENRYLPLGVDSIPIEVPSVLLYSCLYLNEYCDLIDDSSDLVFLYQNMTENFVRDNYLTLFTDPFYRFAVMEAFIN